MSFRFQITMSVLCMALLTAGAGCTSGRSEPAAAPQSLSQNAAAENPAEATAEKANEAQTPVDTTALAIASAHEQGIPDNELVMFIERKKQYPEHVHGIDVSHHQESVDWKTVADAGIDFVYCKATEGDDFVDPMFGEYWRGTEEAGLAHGAYHMFRPEDEDDPQIANFVNTIRAAGVGTKMLPPVLDIERNSGVKKVSRHILHQRAVIWVKGVEKALGIKPVVYTSPKFWQDYLSGDHELVKFPLWVSEYELGAVTPESTGAWKDWTLWQFSQYGIVPGISKPVDLNRLSVGLENLYGSDGR